jgi:hypothetical protein
MHNNSNDVLGNYGIDTPVFNLRGSCQIARVVDIVDGDTVYVVFAPFGVFYKFKTRLLGIDTPELSQSKTGNNDNDEKSDGLDSYLYTISYICGDDYIYTNRKDLQSFLNDNLILVYIKCYNFDNFGRVLVEIWNVDNTGIYSGEKCLNTHLLRNDLADLYK